MGACPGRGPGRVPRREGLNVMTIEPFVAEREWTVEEIPVLSAQVTVPQPVPAADRVSRRIRKYYQLQCRSYLRYCEKWLLPQAKAEYQAALASSTPLPHFRAELWYQVTYREGRFLSLYTQSRETLGRSTALTRRGDTWDLVQGFPVPLQSFFPPRSAWKKQLTALAAEEIQRQERAGISQYHEGWRKLLRRRFDPQNYYLTEDGAAFFYPMYAIAPAAEGIPTFLIPYGDRLARPGGPEQGAETAEHPAEG